MKELKIQPKMISAFLGTLLAIALGAGCFAAGWLTGHSQGYQSGYVSGRNAKSNFDLAVEITEAALEGNNNRILSDLWDADDIAEFINDLNLAMESLKK